MINASPSLIQRLKSGIVEQHVKIELLTKDETLIEEITSEIIEGNISIDRDRDIRRSCSLTIENYNNKYTPSPGGKIWLDKKIRLHVGLRLSNGTIEYVPQGVFRITRPIAYSGVGQIPQVRLEGLDKMSGWGKIVNDLTISAGVSVPVALQLILSGVETKFNFDECTETIPYQLNYTPGTDRKQIVKEIVDMITWDCYYNVYGELRLKQLSTQPENGVVTWTYQPEDYTLYAGSEKELDDNELFNMVLVVGASSQSSTVSATSKDDDVLSPFSTWSIGERLYIHNNGTPDPLIVSVELAQARSNYELRRKLQYVEKQRLQIVPNFLHEEGDIIEIIDSNHQTNGKYELLRFNIPLTTNGNMDCEAWRTRRLL